MRKNLDESKKKYLHRKTAIYSLKGRKYGKMNKMSTLKQSLKVFNSLEGFLDTAVSNVDFENYGKIFSSFFLLISHSVIYS